MRGLRTIALAMREGGGSLPRPPTYPQRGPPPRRWIVDENCRSMDAWPRCLERLEAELPAEDVHTWLKPLQARLRDDGIVLYAPNAFVMEEVRERYLDRIRELLAYYAGDAQVSLEIGALRREPAAAPTLPGVTRITPSASVPLTRAR